MNPIEQSLLSTLSQAPDDWSVRILLASKFFQRGAVAEAAELISQAPYAPSDPETLLQAVNLGGSHALQVAMGYSAGKPSDPYGHEMLSHLYTQSGDQSRGAEHLQLAQVLRGAAESQAPTIPGVGPQIVAPEPLQPITEMPSAAAQAAASQASAMPVAGAPVVAPEPLQPITEMPAAAAQTTQAKKPSKPKAKAKVKPSRVFTAVVATLIAHVVLALIALFIIVLKQPPQPKVTVAALQPTIKKAPEIAKKNITKVVKKSSSSAAATSSIANMLRANAQVKINLPKVQKPSTVPLGLGVGSLGSWGSGLSGLGNGSGKGSGLGNGSGLFGNSGGGSKFAGSFFDLKQNRERGSSGFDLERDSYFDLLEKYSRKDFDSSITDKFYKANVALSFENLLVPIQSADVGPKAFGVEKEVQPKGWFVHYSGRVVSPKSGSWRFVGAFDDAIYVYVNGRLVLDGGRRIDNGRSGKALTPADFVSNAPAIAGSWVDLRSDFKLDIVIGERPGGSVGGGLMIQEKKGRYEERSDGSPIIHLFTTVPLSNEVKRRIRDYPYDIAIDDTPVFTVF